LSSIPFNPGDVILTTGNDYLSNFISFISLQKRFGVKIVILNNMPSGEVDLADLKKKLREFSPRVLSVFHIHNKQWTMDNGQWTMGNGQWAMGNVSVQ